MPFLTQSFGGGDWRRNPVVRFFASLKTGVTLIALILLYSSIMSALPQVRGAVEMTEMEAFSHWAFTTLVALLMISVTVATLARIRFNLLNAGVLTVHAGLLLLCGGSIVYFATKIEGDVLLRSPQVQLIGMSSGGSRTFATFLAEQGSSWSGTLPALGGELRVEVAELNPSTGVVTLEARIGDEPPRRVQAPPNTGSVSLNERIAAQVVRFPATRTFYDGDRTALYYRASDEPEAHFVEIEGLPLYRERYLDDGPPLTDIFGRVSPSKRTRTAISLGPIPIPTDWFEHWRMPIPLATPEAPFDAEITGYVPYIADMRSFAVESPGGEPLNPAMNIHLAVAGSEQSRQDALFALDPRGSMMNIQMPVEFRYVRSAEERESLLTPLAGAEELLIELKDPPLSKRVAIQAGQRIALEGTQYELTVQQLFPQWPLMSPGFEQANSPAVLVQVVTPDKRYTRTVIQRFPQLSQDIDEQGMRRREGLYDENLTLRYRSAVRGGLLFIADEESLAAGSCELGAFDSSGAVERRTLRAGTTERVTLAGMPLDITASGLFRSAQRIELPIIEALERRRPSAERNASAIRVKFTGRGELADWSESRWITFSQYPDVEARPVRVQPPGSPRFWDITYSRVPHDLGAWLTPGKLSVVFFPGRQSVETWRSDFLVQSDSGLAPQPAAVYTNQTTRAGAYTLFQSGASNDHWSYTILGVGNRNGIAPMLAGCVMIPLGCLYAFYAKPVLRRRRQQRALAEAAARGVTPGARQGGPQPEIVEVRS